MHEFCQLEKILQEKLIHEEKNNLLAYYGIARDYLFNNIYPEIKSKLPEYTYHDGSHVINVLNCLHKLLDTNLEKISPVVLYFLCLSILFHDVGLIFGRENHQKNITEIYNRVRGIENIQNFANERVIITKTIEAHTGFAPDNSRDTIKYLGDCIGYDEIINTKEIAAMIRFADELAEGGHRTSDFFLENGMYHEESKIFHWYSKSYQSAISPRDNRLAITYNIIFNINASNELIIDQDIKLEEFLTFIYKRLIKLDDERKYCRYYCLWLEAIKEISVTFNFWYNDDHIEIGLAPIILSDKIVPGETKRKLEDAFPDYTYADIDNILRVKINTIPTGVSI